MSTRTTLRKRLEQYATDVAIVRQLHDVPPYRVHEVRLDDRRAVVKIDAHPRGHAAAEGRVQEYVATNTSVPVPRVLAVGEDHFVAEWDDDAPHEAQTVTDDWSHAVGRWMGELHAQTAGDFDAFGRPVASDGLEIEGHDDWLSAVRARLAYHRPFLEEVGHADVVGAVDDVLHDRPAAFDGAGEPVLCHGNLHPEHAAVRDGDVTAVVDFEHALVAPGEYDYWRIVLPVFAGRDDSEERALRAFRDGYESVHSLPSGFERRSELYLLVNLVSYLEALYLQQNVGAAERAERSEWMRTAVFDRIESLRGSDG
ncbi:phosphotransferase family protein [Halomontanus rarus]|uniref:phosphotransferase family protein n=1 Tax=Halomontanus rarus TaxID=3034020 RepID=UPI0023E8F32C|nr:phosphotransferase [Halovivax sp. TS33]